MDRRYHIIYATIASVAMLISLGAIIVASIALKSSESATTSSPSAPVTSSSSTSSATLSSSGIYSGNFDVSRRFCFVMRTPSRIEEDSVRGFVEFFPLATPPMICFNFSCPKLCNMTAIRIYQPMSFVNYENQANFTFFLLSSPFDYVYEQLEYHSCKSSSSITTEKLNEVIKNPALFTLLFMLSTPTNSGIYSFTDEFTSLC